MSNFITPYTELAQIPKRKYQGYIWYSDGEQKIGESKQKPDVLKEFKEFSFAETESNPFVIEALLYSKEEDISVMVRHTGKYHITEYNLKELPKNAILETEKEYFPHRLDINNKVCFKQLWIPEKDSNCADMEVLNLKAIIFTGFNHTQNS